MRKSSLFLSFFFFLNQLYAQKPCIDSSAYDNWLSVGATTISNDGNYGLYYISSQLRRSDTMVIQSINDKWQMKLPGCKKGQFAYNNRIAVFIRGKDTLCLLTLGSSDIVYIPNVESFMLSGQGKSEWLAYQLDTGPRNLVVRNLTTGNERSLSHMLSYLFNDNGKILLLQEKIENEGKIALKMFDLSEDSISSIWKGVSASNFVFDGKGTQLAFVGEENNDKKRAIYFFIYGSDKAEKLVGDIMPDLDSSLQLSNIVSFNNDGRKLFFKVKNINKRGSSNLKPPIVTIWSYSDEKLQSQQLAELNNDVLSSKEYTCVVHVSNHKIIQIEYGDERILSPNQFLFNKYNSDFILVQDRGKGDVMNEWNWNNSALTSVYLVSTTDGHRKMLKKNINVLISFNFALSPTGKYVIFYEPRAKCYYSYTVTSGIIRNIVPGIQTIWTTYHRDDEPVAQFATMGIAGWSKDDLAVLIYDQNDIFKIDLTGKMSPINLTNGYGRRTGIVFHLAMDQRYIPIGSNDTILLSAFNRKNKDNGFYRVVLGKRVADPELLVMQPYMFEGSWESDEFAPFIPIKARDKNIYLVRKMSASESPNYFVTNNFRTFSLLTDVHPERRYNWLTTQLITWRTIDGDTAQGVLYKPENFDSKRKYPIIFYYYERLSEGLNGFIRPTYSNATMNIPYYVSNGYLVFTPDIHYKIGHPGKSAYNSIVSSASYLMKFSWVDSKRMGIHGHSFGGFETNYLVTHTNMFAAAVSAAGMSDFVSIYGSIIGGGISRQRQYELHRDRIGKTLWQNKDLYLENSPVLRADMVTTPLLMMNNRDDKDVPFSQGIEFFTALRRLGKKAWMLQYEGEDHVLESHRAVKDYTIRMQQFFDHYLKGKAAPKWMVKGMPARLRNSDMEYELELDGLGPGEGLLISDKSDQ